jgi:signal transduction histidine kinase
MLRMRAEEAGVRLLAPHVPDLLKLRCDRLRLKQALLNLISNAIKFTPKYGEVAIASGPTDDGIAISVSDTGIGMRPEDIPRALEPFRQIDAAFGLKYDGVGLGLALTKSLVELHGGRLDLSSELGRGTTATIYLPASRIVMGDAPA